MLDVKCASDAQWVIQSAVRSHLDIWQRIDNIEDYLLRLDKPYSEEEVKNMGYSWTCNQNFGKGRTKVEQDVQQNVGDILQALAFLQISFRPYNKKKDKDKIYQFLADETLRARFKDTIASCFLDALDKDSHLSSWLNKIEYCLYTFAHCSITRDIFGYLGFPNHPRSIGYEDRTRISNVQTHILFDVVKADYLYDILKENNQAPDPEAIIDLSSTNDPLSKEDPVMDGDPYAYTTYENGWIEEGLIEIFRLALIDDPKNKAEKKVESGYTVVDQDNLPVNQFNSWQDIQTFVNKWGLPYIYSNINNVYIAKIYYWIDSEFWEVYIAVKGDILSKNIPIPNVNKFLLYRKNHGKKQVKEVINVIKEATLNVNDWIHELKGWGKIIAEDSLRYDIKRCKLEDRLTINGCAVIETTNEFQSGQLKIAVIGGLVVPEAGIKILASPFDMNLEQFQQSIEFDEQQFQQKTSYLAPQVSGNLGNRATKDEVQAVSQEVASARGGKAPLKFKDYSDVLFNAINELSENDLMTDSNKDIRQSFFDDIRSSFSDIIDPEDFPDEDIQKIIACIDGVRFTPAIRDTQALQQAMEMAGNDDQKVRLQKMYLMALGFDRKDTEDLLDEQNYGEQVSIAAIENDMFSRTVEVAFGISQDHITHGNMHFAKMDRVMTQLQAQQTDIMSAFKFLTNALQNTSQHVAAIQGSYFYADKYKDFNKYQKYFAAKAKSLSDTIIQMQQQAAQQQQQGQQQQQPQLDPKTQASIYNDRIKMLDKIKRTDLLTNDKRQRIVQEFQTRMQLLQQETAARIQRENTLSQNKVSSQNLQTSANLVSSQPQPQTPVNITDGPTSLADAA